VYHPQFTYGHAPYEAFEDPNKTIGDAYHASHANKPLTSKHRANTDGSRYPRSVQRFAQDRGGHPTKKPVPFMRWLIRSYSNPGDLVLDNTMGEGTTGVACMVEGRRFVGIELDPDWYGVACQQLQAAVTQGILLLPPEDTAPADTQGSPETQHAATVQMAMPFAG
jgi:site-specific DNA-methyltransferase (adenine-specific)